MGTPSISYLTAAGNTDPDGTAPTHVGDPSTDLVYTYSVEIEPGETVTIPGTLTTFTGGELGFLSTPQWGTYAAADNGAHLNFTWGFTYDEWGNFDQGNMTAQVGFAALRGGDPGAAGSDLDAFFVDIICFGAGTMIAMPQVESAVESLRIGDEVPTTSGRCVPVTWAGVQTVSTEFAPPERLRPVRIKAGALGQDRPHCDPTVTADHGMVIDGLVITAAALVNGTTIDFVPLTELASEFSVYHVETEDHDVILANGAPAETFIDYIGRKAFDTYARHLDLYGAKRIIRGMPAPRVSAARPVAEEIKARLGGDRGRPCRDLRRRVAAARRLWGKVADNAGRHFGTSEAARTIAPGPLSTKSVCWFQRKANRLGPD